MLDWIILYQKFWNRHEELISWIYRVIPSKSVEPDIKYLQIEHTEWFNPEVLNQTWSIDKLMESPYVQIVCSSCLVQNFWMETPCMFSLSTSYLVQQFWIELPCMFEPDMKYWQIEHTGRFNPKVLNQTWRTDKLNIQGDSIQKCSTRH
jgi:hypothetical protein